MHSVIMHVFQSDRTDWYSVVSLPLSLDRQNIDICVPNCNLDANIFFKDCVIIRYDLIRELNISQSLGKYHDNPILIVVTRTQGLDILNAHLPPRPCTALLSTSLQQN